jgi:phytoene dehydrogenase-like protein
VKSASQTAAGAHAEDGRAECTDGEGLADQAQEEPPQQRHQQDRRHDEIDRGQLLHEASVGQPRAALRSTLAPVQDARSADVVVIGAGHNGLVAAAYLARAGLRTLVVERREVIGGASVTEELWPGYRVSRGAYVAGLLRPCVVRELSLAEHGLRLLRRSPSSFTPLPDGRALLLGPDTEASLQSIRQFSARDADRFPAYEAFLDGIARVIEPLLDAPPPSFAHPSLADLRSLAAAARRAWRVRADLPRAFNLLLGAARPALEAWFESEPLRATLATDAVIGAWAPPSAPGTGYVLFHHVMGETHGERGVWAYVEGGMGSLAEAIASAATRAGVEILRGAPVSRIDVQDGRARGVTLEDGREIAARRVVSSVDPHTTLCRMVDAAHVPDAVTRELEALDFRSGVVKINLALDRLPRFVGTQGATPGLEHQGTIHIGALGLDAIEDAFAAAAAGRLPERPMIELTLPSALDATLAPQGRHVASMFVQYAPYALAAGSWDDERDRFGDLVFSLVDEVAPGFSSSVLHREVLAPPDLERVFALRGGNIFHGAMTPDRLALARPVPGWGYRTPVDGLYLCGAGTHPGGGVMGACGRNAAQSILRER